MAQIVVHNSSGVTQSVPKGACLGEADAAQLLYVLEPGEDDLDTAQCVTVTKITMETEAWRREKLLRTIEPPELPVMVQEYSKSFWLTTTMSLAWRRVSMKKNLVRMEINTGGNSPKKQPPGG